MPLGIKLIRRGSKLLKIRLDIDIDPTLGFKTETRYLFAPIPFSINAYKPSYIFAGKMHAVLCRKWQNRIKGRDWYDFVWFVSRGIPLNIQHLGNRLCQSGHLDDSKKLSIELFIEMLLQRIDTLDFETAKRDISPFLNDQSAISLWSRHFFKEVSSRIIFEQN